MGVEAQTGLRQKCVVGWMVHKVGWKRPCNLLFVEGLTGEGIRWEWGWSRLRGNCALVFRHSCDQANLTTECLIALNNVWVGKLTLLWEASGLRQEHKNLEGSIPISPYLDILGRAKSCGFLRAGALQTSLGNMSVFRFPKTKFQFSSCLFPRPTNLR